ncbi:MAG: PadR family transcriptional regulator [Acidimicrobiales bacterium]|nr:PadR family transcriptional regulator [Acidimicrobiales bacterium]
MAATDSNYPLSPKEEIVLGAVAASSKGRKGVHGYPLAQEIDALRPRHFSMNYATLYRVLNRLEVQGYLRSELAKKGTYPGRSRRSYRVSPEGRKMLRKSEVAVKRDDDGELYVEF